MVGVFITVGEGLRSDEYRAAMEARQLAAAEARQLAADEAAAEAALQAAIDEPPEMPEVEYVPPAVVEPTPAPEPEPLPEETPEPSPTPEPTPSPTPPPTPEPMPTPLPIAEPPVEMALYDLIVEIVQSTNANLRYVEIFEHSTDSESYHVNVNLYLRNNLSIALERRGAMMDARDILRLLQGINDVAEIDIGWRTDFVNAFGETIQGQAMRIWISRANLDRINFDTFLTDNIFAVSDGYIFHPAFRP